MTQPDLLTLAQQGNSAAIARWFNQILQPCGVTARVLLKANRLKILLLVSSSEGESASYPPLEPQEWVALLQPRIRELNLPNLQAIRVYYQTPEGDRPSWRVDLDPLTVMPIQPGTLSENPLKNPSGSPSGNSSRIKRTAPTPTAAEPAESIVDLDIACSPDLPDDLSSSLAAGTALFPLADREDTHSLIRRKISLTALFPYQKVLRPALYRSAIVRLLLFLALVPLTINLLAAQVLLSHVAWLTGIYYAIVWALLLYHLIQPTRVSWKRTIAGVLFTVFISIPVLLMVQRLPPFNLLYGAVGQGLAGRLVGFVLGVGVLEEICKAIPVLLMVVVRPKNLSKRSHSPNSSPNPSLPDPRTAAFYGAMCGLGFAVAESGAYSVQYAIALMRGQLDLGLYLAANTIRFVSLPLFHAVLTGIVGYFIGLALGYPAAYPGRRFLLLGAGLAIVAVLHGLYNAFSGGFSGIAIIGFSIALLIAYLDSDTSLPRGG